MAAFKILEQALYCGRDFKLSVAIYDDDDRAVAIAVGDIVRAKLAATEGAAPTLDVDSGAPAGGGSNMSITTRGNVSDPNPANWIPATCIIEFRPADTKTIPTTDAWAATLQSKKYVLDLSVTILATGILTPIGRGLVTLHRSPGGKRDVIADG
jgi:hypothetical protein